MFKENETQYCKNCYELQEQLDQLKAENDELKGIRDRNFLHALEEQKRADKFSKTLTEIKEIAEEWEGAESAYMVSSLILQKISECEVVNDRNE